MQKKERSLIIGRAPSSESQTGNQALVKNEENKAKLRDKEMKALLENSDLSVAPNKLDQKEEKADVIYRLKCTDYLRREFDIPEE